MSAARLRKVLISPSAPACSLTYSIDIFVTLFCVSIEHKMRLNEPCNKRVMSLIFVSTTHRWNARLVRHLPPLNALRAFEAAARLLSFSKAADELHVTHGAVSRSVRQLEGDLGIQLFLRTTRSVRLTPTGAAYAQEIRGALDLLAAATASVARQRSSGMLNVTTVDSFAAKWLVPRLFRFRRAYGDIDVRLSTSERLADFVKDGMDIALRCGRGRYPGLQSELLMEEDLSPVCSPALLDGAHPLRAPEDLKHHTLIHDDFHVNWSIWLRAAGITGIDPHRGPAFYSSEHAVQAAVLGQGVVLGRSALVAD